MAKSKFEEDIENFVDTYLNSQPSPKHSDTGKVIHDALWGTHYVQPHELAILDTPLIQRLRSIKQTAFAYLIFPSATHSRFEHTLGVIFQSAKLVSSLAERYPKLFEGKKDTIRMAALLHDCGHGPFSHSSEEIYKFLPDIQEIIGPKGTLEGYNAHEVLSHYIVKSAPFESYFRKVCAEYSVSVDLEQIAQFIIGNCSDPNDKYLFDIVNGPFDADKLDYLYRDGHFSGLPLKIDLDRLWYSVQVAQVSRPDNAPRMLVMSINGTVPLEQILFSKMVLFNSLYQHHKVRTCDCMLKSIYHYCIDKGETIGGKELRKATDFLWLTDDKIYAEADKREPSDILHQLIQKLKYRRLLKRALIISRTTVEEPSKEFFGYTALKQKCADIKEKDPELRELAKAIWEAAGRPCADIDVWVDLPKLPPIGTADDTFVNRGTYKRPDFVKLKDIFMVDDWAQAYAENNWRGHIFCPGEPEIRKKISQAATDVLEATFKIKFNASATELCKIE